MKKMKSFALSGLIAAALVIFVVLLQGTNNTPLHAESTNKIHGLLKEVGPAFTAKEVEAYTMEIMPLVEKATGKKFKQVPKIKLVGRDKLVKALMQDILPLYKNLMPNKNEDQIVKVAKQQAKSMAPTLLGKYGLSDKVLYLMPRNMFPILKREGIDKNHVQSIIKIIITHELVHVLQDQEINLNKKFFAIKQNEELEALNITIEGHAVFVQELVAKQLKLDHAIPDFFKIVAGISERYGERFSEMNYYISAGRLKQIYFGGKRFIEYHYRKGGNRRVWEILSVHPSDTSMIIAPETYSSIRQSKLNYAKILEGLEQYFGDGELSTENFESPKTNLLATYSNIDPQLRTDILSKVAHVQILKVNKKNNKYGYIAIMKLKDKTYASKYISTVEKITKYNYKKMKNSPLYKIEDLSFMTFTGVDADIAMKGEYTLKPSRGNSMKFMVTRICRGDIILEISDVNSRLTDDKIIKIVETIFHRYQKSKEQQENDRSLKVPSLINIVKEKR